MKSYIHHRELIPLTANNTMDVCTSSLVMLSFAWLITVMRTCCFCSA